MPKTFPHQSKGYHPFAELIGLDFTRVEAGTSQCVLSVRDELLNPQRVLHGAVLYAMADTGMGGALYSILDDDELCATLEIKMMYFTPVRAGELTCDTRILRRSKHFGMLESIIMQDQQKTAQATGTFAIWQTDIQTE